MGIPTRSSFPLLRNRFTIRAEHPAYARRIVQSTLCGADVDVVANASLLTSELVADAMSYAGADPQLLFDTTTDHIYVEVRESHPPAHDAVPTRQRGGVMALMNALTSSWGTEARPDGRVVWFYLQQSSPRRLSSL